MSKNYFKGIMRSMREFTAEMDSNKARYDRARAKATEDYAEAKGSMLYDRVFSEVDKLFWSQFVGIGSPDLVSSTADDAPVVQYFFSSVEALSDFIEKAKKGLSEDKAKEVTESILHECPEQYRNVYDEFQRNGTVSDLNNFDESI